MTPRSPGSPGQPRTLKCRREDGLPFFHLDPWAVSEAFDPPLGRHVTGELSRDMKTLNVALLSADEARICTNSVISVQGNKITFATQKQSCQGTIWAPELTPHSIELLTHRFATQGTTTVYRPPHGPGFTPSLGDTPGYQPQPHGTGLVSRRTPPSDSQVWLSSHTG